jgi:phage tail sheath protein FI
LRLNSFADYEREYGGFDARSVLGYCIRHFYDNGGSDAYVLRIAGEGGAFIAPADAEFQTALQALFETGGVTEAIDLFNIVCVPGLADATTIRNLQRRARERGAFLIVDCADTATVATVTDVLAEMTGADAANSALFFPWVRAPDPLQQNALRAFPPCGLVAGIFARTDAARGVWKTPAGTGLFGAEGLTVLISDAENERLNSQAVNCLRRFPDRGTIVFGTRTLDGGDDRGSEWKFIPVRRMALFLEESLLRGTQWAAFEPNAEPLWAALRRSIDIFMLDLFRQRAFQGTTTRDAYFVKCDRTTTTQADIDDGVVNIQVGFAPLKPAEFVIINIRQIAGSAG